MQLLTKNIKKPNWHLLKCKKKKNFARICFGMMKPNWSFLATHITFMLFFFMEATNTFVYNWKYFDPLLKLRLCASFSNESSFCFLMNYFVALETNSACALVAIHLL